MKDIVNSASTGMALPDDYAAQLAAGIAESRATTVLSGGKPFLRLLKSGDWVFGQENEEVQAGSRWLVNTTTLSHGWCCWVDTGNKNQLKGDVMAPMTRPKPACPPPIDDTSFVEQRAFELKCMEGLDAGTEVLYKTNSDGGMKAVDAVMVAVQQQALIKGNVYLFPIVQLLESDYQHPKYGQIFKPIFEIQAWADINGNTRDAVEAQNQTQIQKPASAPVPEPAPASTSARVRKAPLQDTGTPMQPVSTAQVHAGQRRRPVAR